MSLFLAHPLSRDSVGRGGCPGNATGIPGPRGPLNRPLPPLSCRESGIPKMTPGQAKVHLRSFCGQPSRWHLDLRPPCAGSGCCRTEGVGTGREARLGAGSGREAGLKDPKPPGSRKGAGPGPAEVVGSRRRGGERAAPGERRDQHHQYLLQNLDLHPHAGFLRSRRGLDAAHVPGFGATCLCRGTQKTPPPYPRAVGSEVTSESCPGTGRRAEQGGPVPGGWTRYVASAEPCPL